MEARRHEAEWTTRSSVSLLSGGHEVPRDRDGIGDAETHRGIGRSAHRAETSRRAMTLVEVLAVVVILSLIAATLTIGFSGVFGEAKHELAKTAIGVLAGKVETYRMKTNALPPDDLGLAVLSDGHARPTDSFYVSPDQLLDPWDRPFAIIIPGPDGHPYEIISYGADGQPGGEGENADISSIRLRN